MNVLSLFDGMACGRIALERLGIPVTNYYASEIDKYAMKVSAANYPDIIQLGSVTELINIDWSLQKIDLVIGGSPCQGFSFAGKQLNFEDPRSKLFFEYSRILNEIKKANPDVKFLLENVRMKKEHQDVISKYLEVEPITLNSSRVSAQNRHRLYWTNIPGYVEPEDKGILLKDIVHEFSFVDREKSYGTTANYQKMTEDDYLNRRRGQQVFNINPSGKGMNGNVYPISKEKSNCLTTNKGEGQKISVVEDEFYLLEDVPESISIPEATKKGFAEVRIGDGIDTTFIKSKTRRGRLMEDKSNCLTAATYDYGILEDLKQYIVPFDKTLQILEKEVARGKVGYFRKDSQANRVYYIHDKAVTLCGDAGGGAAKMGQYLFGSVNPTKPHQAAEASIFGTQPRQQDRIYNIEGKSIALHLDSSRTAIAIPGPSPETCIKKFYTLTAQDKHGILIEGYIRKLTPVECERLQTVPDNYTAGVSNSQRYRMLGNGWTIDAVVEFLRGLKQKPEFETNLDF